jgi:choline dehydrogenase-like flavoprotein
VYLSAKQRDALACFARILTEGAADGLNDVESLTRNCCEKVATVPAHKRAQLRQALDLLASPIGPLLGIGRPTRFAKLNPADQRRCLSAWGTSRLPILRTAYQALRRLVLVTHYGNPEAGRAIGYRGAFRHRQPEVGWEGPLPPAAAATPEPVARIPIRLPVELAAEAPPAGVHVTLDRPLHRTADVVIIGSGAGGSVAAAELAESGFEVVILDGGGWHTRADFIEDEAAMADRLLAEGGLRTTDDGAMALLQGETVGGGTTVNWMLWLRTPEFVLEQWARESGLDGMRAADLAPVFSELEARLHVSGVPAEAHSANNRLILDGAAALGWAARGGALNATGCVRCGFCTAGCRHDAKQSALVTWLPRAFAAGANLYANMAAHRIELRERDTGAGAGQGTPPLKRVHATHTRTGAALTVDAPIVIVAGGAVGTPALLQRSGFGGDGVGQFLRVHPVTFGFGVYDREIAASTGIPMTTLCDEHLRWGGTDYGFWIETPPVAPWFAAAAIQQFGAAHAARMRQFNQLGVLISLTRDGADRQASSGRVQVNRRGETSITYRLTASDAARVRASLGAMAQLHFANGAREVFTCHTVPRVARHPSEIATLTDAPMGPNELALGSAHVNGTCRLGAHRATSGATPDGERYGVRGLYISDGSLLPTAPGVNPQATIMAVTTVLARRLAARHAGIHRV